MGTPTSVTRTKRRTAGLCENCGKHNDRKPLTLCSECDLKRKAKDKARTSAGLCRQCGSPLDRRATLCSKCKKPSHSDDVHCWCGKRRRKAGKQCEEHYQQGRASRVPRYQTRKSQGLCHKCPTSRISKLSHPDADACPECVCKAAAGKWLNDRTKWEVLLSLFQGQQETCPLSGRALFLGFNAHLDHKTPRADGGTNDLSNLWWVLDRVNRGKDADTVNEYVNLCYDVALTDILAKINLDWIG